MGTGPQLQPFNVVPQAHILVIWAIAAKALNWRTSHRTGLSGPSICCTKGRQLILGECGEALSLPAPIFAIRRQEPAGRCPTVHGEPHSDASKSPK